MAPWSSAHGDWAMTPKKPLSWKLEGAGGSLASAMAAARPKGCGGTAEYPGRLLKPLQGGLVVVVQVAGTCCPHPIGRSEIQGTAACRMQRPPTVAMENVVKLLNKVGDDALSCRTGTKTFGLGTYCT
jgi:hypothetical protein